MSAPHLLNITEVSSLYGCSPNAIWKRARTGRMPAPDYTTGDRDTPLWEYKTIMKWFEESVRS